MAQAALAYDTRNIILQAIAAARQANPAAPEKGTGGGGGASVRFLAKDALAKVSGANWSTLETRLRYVEREHPAEWKEAMQGRFVRVDPMIVPANDDAPEEVPPAPKTRTLDEDVQLHRAQETSRDATRRLKDARQRIAELQDKLSEYERVANSSARPAQWTLAPTMGGREHTPYLLTSDFQVGEVIRTEETDHAHGYDVDIFRRRYRKLIATTIDLCFTEQPTWDYPGIIYARGGDSISGGIHEELAETDELTPVEAVELCFEEEAAGIAHLLEAFGRVEVKGPDEDGNHGRDTKKSRSKNAAGHSYGRLISYMLQREFRNDPRVTFQTSKSPDVYFAIYDTRIVLTHGDKIGSRGGQGFVGPAATIMRGAQKVIAEQQALGRAVDEVHMGHFHVPLELGYAVCNGCLPGYSEYAKMHRLRPESPSQWLLFYHPRFGKVSWKKIWLEEPRPAGLDWLEAAA